MRVLVTGATSLIGRTIVGDLALRGHQVRAFAQTRSWPDQWPRDVERVTGDADMWIDLDGALGGADVVLHTGPTLGMPLSEVAARARRVATHLRDLSETHRVRHIVALNALGSSRDLAQTSAHRFAAWEGVDILRIGSVPVTDLRTGPVLGRGGATLELLLAAARLPVAWWTLWGRHHMQPVGVDDLASVVARIVHDGPHPGSVAAAGPQVLSLNELIETTRAQLSGGSRLVLPSLLPPETATLLVARAAGVSTHRTHALLSSIRQDCVVTTETVLAPLTDEYTSLDALLRDLLGAHALA